MQTNLLDFDQLVCPICRTNTKVHDYHGGYWEATHSCMSKRHPRLYFHRGHRRETCYINRVIVHKEMMLVCRNSDEPIPGL